jgi:hypothetical protein
LPLAAVALLAWWTGIVAGWTPAGLRLFVDWEVYALASQRMLAGTSLYLDVQVAGPYRLPDVTPEGFIYPPPAAVLLTPFSAGGGVGLTSWLIVNVGLFLSGLAAILRREQGAVRPVSLALVLLGLSVPIVIPGVTVITPFPTGVVVANANVGLAGLLAWTWAARPGDGVRGHGGWIPVAAGVAATLKAFPAAFALWPTRRHGWRPLVLAAAVAAAITLVALPLVGVDEWSRYLSALANAVPSCDGGRSSVACVLLPWTGDGLAKAAGVVIGALLLATSVVVRRETLAFTLLTLGMLAPLADGHPHYLLFGYVLIVIAACRVRPGPRLAA